MSPYSRALSTDLLDYSRFDGIEWAPREIHHKRMVAVDVETNGKPWYSGECQIRTVAVCNHLDSKCYEWHRSAHRLALQRSLGDEKLTKIMHNGQADLLWLLAGGMEVCGPLQDTISMARCANNLETLVGLDALGLKYLHMGKTEKESKVWELPMKELRAYNKRDAEITYLLLVHGLRRRDVDDWWSTYQKEVELIHPVIRMHQIGLELDYEWCLWFIMQAYGELDRLARGFNGYNVNSFQQLNKLLFEEEKLKPALGHEKLKSGEYSTAEKWLKRMKKGTLVDDVLRYRSWFKDCGYVKGLVKAAQWDGKVHSQLLPYTAKTGRWSTKKPNVQQIPGAPHYCRHAFKTPSGYELWSWDYDQMEIRIGAAESGEPSLIKAFEEGRDIHSETAKRLGITRDHAKVVIYAFMYGSGAETMADTLRITLEDAYDIVRSFRRNLPRIVSFASRLKRDISKKGSLVNPMGRKFRCKEAYQALDYWIQGTGADILKDRLKKVFYRLQKCKSEVIFPIHDELVGMIHRDELELIPEIQDIMEEKELYCIPLTVTRGLFYDKH